MKLKGRRMKSENLNFTWDYRAHKKNALGSMENSDCRGPLSLEDYFGFLEQFDPPADAPMQERHVDKKFSLEFTKDRIKRRNSTVDGSE